MPILTVYKSFYGIAECPKQHAELGGIVRRISKSLAQNFLNFLQNSVDLIVTTASTTERCQWLEAKSNKQLTPWDSALCCIQNLTLFKNMTAWHVNFCMAVFLKFHTDLLCWCSSVIDCCSRIWDTASGQCLKTLIGKYLSCYNAYVVHFWHICLGMNGVTFGQSSFTDLDFVDDVSFWHLKCWPLKQHF